jgi:hypothetical protein
MSEPHAVEQDSGETSSSEEAAPFPVDLSSYEEPPRPDEAFLSVIEAERFERSLRGRQEWVRTALAVGAFLSLVSILLVLLIAVIGHISAENIEKVSAVVVTPLTGIVGTIVGFYFAEKRLGN